MRLPDEPDIPAQINIVPMIDVIFAILTFFIMSTLFLTRSEGLLVNLPQASSAIQPSTPITLTIDAQGNIALNRKSVQIETLNTQVQQLIKPDRETLVIINADAAVKHGQVVAVMDRVRQIPKAKLAIATQKP